MKKKPSGLLGFLGYWSESHENFLQPNADIYVIGIDLHYQLLR